MTRLSAKAAMELIMNLSENNDSFDESASEDEIFGELSPINVDVDHIQQDEEEEDGEIDFYVQNDTDSESDSNEVEEEVLPSEIQVNDIIFSTEPFQSRSRNRNITNFHPRNLAHPSSEKEAFQLFINEEIVLIILRYTNRKVSDVIRTVRKIHSYMCPFTFDEILACLAILLRAGLDRDNFTSIEELWNPTEGRPFFRAVISILRFKFFLRTARFDNFRNREERLKDDRLTAIREIWDLFQRNLMRFYVPDTVLTVDEQLVGYRGKVPGRTYLPSKPAKYGVKIFWLCEAKSGFALNSIIYTGKKDNKVHRNLGKDVVMELCVPVYGSRRDIVTDNYFTSHSLATSLLEKDLTLLGTVRLNRREIPPQLKSKDRQPNSSVFVHDHENKIVMVSYCPKKNRNVVLLSSSHSGNEIVPESSMKPRMIIDYNFGKEWTSSMRTLRNLHAGERQFVGRYFFFIICLMCRLSTLFS